MKSIEEIIKEYLSIEKVQTLISIDRYSHGRQEKISQGYNPLGSILKKKTTQPTPNKNKYKYSNKP